MSGRYPDNEGKIEDLRTALHDAINTDNRHKENMLRGYLGKALMQAGLIPEALTQFEAALKLVEQLNDPVSKARHLGNQGMALAYIGNYDQAMTSLKQALAIGENLRLIDVRCDALLQIAFLQFHEGNPEAAFASLDQVELLTNEQNQARNMQASAFRGDIYTQINQPDKAADQYQKALNIADRLEETKVALMYQELLIKALIDSTNLPGAVSQIIRGLERLKYVEGGNKMAVVLLNYLANIQYEQEEFEKALETNKTALKLACEQGNVDLQIRLLGSLSTIQAERGLVDEAIQYAQQSVSLAQKEGDTLLTASQIVLLGLAYRDQGNTMQAREVLEQAKAIYRREEQVTLVDQVNSFIQEMELSSRYKEV